MANKNRFPWDKSARVLQQTVLQSSGAASASYTLIGALVLLGGIGYAVDYYQGTSPWGLLAGLGLGVVVGFYELIKTIWPR